MAMKKHTPIMLELEAPALNDDTDNTVFGAK